MYTSTHLKLNTLDCPFIVFISFTESGQLNDPHYKICKNTTQMNVVTMLVSIPTLTHRNYTKQPLPPTLTQNRKLSLN